MEPLEVKQFISSRSIRSPVALRRHPLLANTSYEIVGNSNANGYGINAVNSVFTGITYGTSVYKVNTTTPDFNPNTYGSNDIGNFGPNFQFEAVPEASTAIALGLMLASGGLAIVARKRIVKS